MKEIVILGGARTPIGSFQGALASFSAPEARRSRDSRRTRARGVKPEQIEHVIMGNVLQGGIGQAPARQAAIGAGIPDSAGAITVNKVCGSGLQAVMSAANDIRCGEYDIAVAGGMESMTNAPYILAAGARRLPDGQRQGRRPDDPRRPVGPVRRQAHGQLRRDVRREVRVHARGAGRVRARVVRRAQDAAKSGKFTDEIVPVEIESKKGSSMVVDDEEPFDAPLDKMAHAQAGVQDGRLGHGGQRVEDQRRRRGARGRVAPSRPRRTA